MCGVPVPWDTGLHETVERGCYLTEAWDVAAVVVEEAQGGPECW